MKKLPHPVDILNLLNRPKVDRAVIKAIDRILSDDLDTRVIESEYSGPFRILNSPTGVKQRDEATRIFLFNMVLAISLLNYPIPTVLLPSQMDEWESSSLNTQQEIRHRASRGWKRKFISSESKQKGSFGTTLLVLRRHASLYSSMCIRFNDGAKMAYIMNPHPTLRVQALEKLACFYSKQDLSVKYTPVKGGGTTEFESLVLSLYFLWECCKPKSSVITSLTPKEHFDNARRTLITIANVFLRIVIAIPRVKDLEYDYPGLDIGRLSMEDVWIITSDQFIKEEIKKRVKKGRPYLIVHIAKDESRYVYKVGDDGSFKIIDPRQEEDDSAQRKYDHSKQMQATENSKKKKKKTTETPRKNKKNPRKNKKKTTENPRKNKKKKKKKKKNTETPNTNPNENTEHQSERTSVQSKVQSSSNTHSNPKSHDELDMDLIDGLEQDLIEVLGY